MIFSENNYKYVLKKINELANIEVVTIDKSKNQLLQSYAVRRNQHKIIGDYLLSFNEPVQIFEAVKEWSSYWHSMKQFKRLNKTVSKDNTIWGRKTATFGNSNRNTVRYPSRKRSLRTWANFYKLFPHLIPSENDYKVPVRNAAYFQITS